MAQMIDDEAFGNDAEKMSKDDQRLAVRFTTEQRLNHAMMAKIDEINAALENTAALMEVAGKFDEAKAERAKKLPADPVYRSIEFISINIPGDKTLTIHRPVMASDKRRFRAKYEAFKSAAGEPLEGTPIEQLPEIKPSQITDLKYCNVSTIEALSAVPDSSPLLTMMGGRSLKNRAAEWVKKNRKSRIVEQTNEALAERDAQIAKLQEQVAALVAASEAARGAEPAKVARK